MNVCKIKGKQKEIPICFSDSAAIIAVVSDEKLWSHWRTSLQSEVINTGWIMPPLLLDAVRNYRCGLDSSGSG